MSYRPMDHGASPMVHRTCSVNQNLSSMVNNTYAMHYINVLWAVKHVLQHLLRPNDIFYDRRILLYRHRKCSMVIEQRLCRHRKCSMFIEQRAVAIEQVLWP